MVVDDRLRLNASSTERRRRAFVFRIAIEVSENENLGVCGCAPASGFVPPYSKNDGFAQEPIRRLFAARTRRPYRGPLKPDAPYEAPRSGAERQPEAVSKPTCGIRLQADYNR
jgi:hypothetical protein